MEDQRITATVDALKQSKAQGLSFYDARQALARSGFTDTEIADAADRFNYEDDATVSRPPAASEATSLSSVPEEPLVDEQLSTALRQWSVIDYLQPLVCASGIALVWYMGGRYNTTHSLLALFEFLGAAALTALTIVYYGFVAKIMVIGRYRGITYSGQQAAVASLVWLAALGVVIVEILRLG